MIVPAAPTDALIARLKTRAMRAAEARAAAIADAGKAGPINWRSARSLWPDL